jgi:hypothetical protein
MPTRPTAPKITDFVTSFDAAPVMTAEGEVIWADVRIDYILSGLAPAVIIRVPVACRAGDTLEARKAQALRSARDLIDHACVAAAMSPVQSPGVTEALREMVPSSLEGGAQELGLVEPSTQSTKTGARG